MEGREEVEPSQTEREPPEQREWEAAPSAEHMAPAQPGLRNPAETCRETCLGTLGGFPASHCSGGSPEHGELQQRSPQSAEGETAAKGFSWLRVERESDSSGALVDFGVYFPVEASQPSFLQQGLGEGKGTKEETGAWHGMVAMRNERSCFRFKYQFLLSREGLR